MNRKFHQVIMVAAILLAGGLAAQAARQAAVKPAESEEANADVAAARLVDRAQELFDVQESERGAKMLENVIDQYPGSKQRYKAYLVLGRHYVATQKFSEAIQTLRPLLGLAKPDAPPPTDEEKEWRLEGQFLTGVAYFNLRQYDMTFTILRAITRNEPNSTWANQAYYYIGMCHFAQKNWIKAVESLSMMGAAVDPNAPSLEFAEAGRRLYVKVEDNDIAVMPDDGKGIPARVEAAGGDKEVVTLFPIAKKNAVAVGSIPTDAGLAKAGDGSLQIIGGDTATIIYTDQNNAEGKPVEVKRQVKMVSSAELEFSVGTYETRSAAAFVGQPLFVMLLDLDLDRTPEADKVAVKIVSRYKPEEDAGTAGVINADVLARSENERGMIERDEVTLTLTELGLPPVHSGRFGGKLETQAVAPGTPLSKTDQVLAIAVGDEIAAVYMDELNVNGAERKEVKAVVPVIGEIDGRPLATQNVVFDPMVKARKQIVEATAFLELTRIFRSMGLMRQANEKAREGLERAQNIIMSQSSIPNRLREEAFKLKWELYIEIEDYANAVAICQLFSRLFPDSAFVDDALLRIGMAQMEANHYEEALRVFSNILNLPNSTARAEAQFRIAETYAKTMRKDAMLSAYRKCAEDYPNSEFAGKSLIKLVDNLIENKDYKQADELLEQIFQDYPDANFLDGILSKWVVVAYRTGNQTKAAEKARQLLMEYPGSSYADQTKKILPQLERKATP